MAKRELLIVAGFGLTGLIAYQLAVPAPPDGSPRASLSSLVSSWRDRANRANSHATVQSTGSIAADSRLNEVRIADISRVTVTPGRGDAIEWTLETDSTGPTEAAARATAARTTLEQDNLGDVMVLSARAPRDSRSTSVLSLRVPPRLQIRLENTRRGEVSGVAGVRLENVVGDVTLSGIAGEVTGSHRNGALDISDARSVRLTLVGSHSVIRRTTGDTVIAARNGESRLDAPVGAVQLDITNERTDVVEPAGIVRANGSGGALTIDRPRQALHVDTRRTHVTVTLDVPVAVSVLSADAPLALHLADALPIMLDAVASENRIQADAIGLTAEQIDGTARLQHEFGNKARVSLRNQRGEIVITPRK